VVGAFALWPSVDVTVSDIRNAGDPLSVDFTVTNSNPYTIEHVMADVNPRKLGSFDPRLRMFPTTWDHDKTLERHGSLSFALNDVLIGHDPHLSGEIVIFVSYKKAFIQFQQKFGFRLAPDMYGNERWTRFPPDLSPWAAGKSQKAFN
jgi:hypothetical protein